MFTILISVEDPNIAKRFSLSLYNEDDFLAFNQTDELKGYFDLTANIGNDFEYDNHTMLYNIPVNLVLRTPFDPNDDVTTHMTKLNMKYIDNNLSSRETVDVILHERGKLFYSCQQFYFCILIPYDWLADKFFSLKTEVSDIYV